jgi:hypothetical protein
LATAGPLVRDAVEYVSSRLAADAEQAGRAEFLNASETSVVRDAQKLVGADTQTLESLLGRAGDALRAVTPDEEEARFQTLADHPSPPGEL